MFELSGPAGFHGSWLYLDPGPSPAVAPLKPTSTMIIVIRHFTITIADTVNAFIQICLLNPMMVLLLQLFFFSLLSLSHLCHIHWTCYRLLCCSFCTHVIYWSIEPRERKPSSASLPKFFPFFPPVTSYFGGGGFCGDVRDKGEKRLNSPLRQICDLFLGWYK